MFKVDLRKPESNKIIVKEYHYCLTWVEFFRDRNGDWDTELMEKYFDSEHATLDHKDWLERKSKDGTLKVSHIEYRYYQRPITRTVFPDDWAE
jgi:homoserine trans-succinylase